MAILDTFNKQPGEVLDYDIDFARYLPSSDQIASVVSTADAGITLDSSTISTSGKVVKQWVSGGVSGVTYKIQVRITSTGGRVKEAEFRIKVKEI